MSIRKLETVEEVLKESDVSCPDHQPDAAFSQPLLACHRKQTHCLRKGLHGLQLRLQGSLHNVGCEFALRPDRRDHTPDEH